MAFGLVHRCTPARLRQHTDAELQQFIDEFYENRRHNARLRRELDALRNHVPLFGDVFNGKVL